MAGLYIHIPFCRNACHYCDFHFSISLGQLSLMMKAIQKEICSRKKFLGGEPIDTIYLGGGTPSLLSSDQLNSLFHMIRDNYDIRSDPEITLEGNPEDLEPQYLEDLLKIGINRLSIGIQSFHDGDLELMNRRHGKDQSHYCLELIVKSGFKNINIDLIYGVPGLTTEKWVENLDIVSDFAPAHIAAYHLTYEAGTVLDYRRLQSRFDIQGEQKSLEQYRLLVKKLEDKGYEHYEISNFAQPGYISRHNSAYWRGKKYLGVGPSAHSFNGRIRRWNISKNASYIKFVNQGSVYHEQEELDRDSRFHDYLVTSLRTTWGADLEYIHREYGQAYAGHCLQQAKPFLQSGRLILDDSKLVLSEDGMFIADHIISALFLEKE
jgi:oxygen-independent coproporphyrinogen-3 oxidase